MFNLDNPFWNTISKLCDLVILNVLFIVCCIPIITVGSSVTALYVVMGKMIRDEGGSVVREFFNALRNNFKQSTIIWLFLLPFGILTIYEMYLMTLNEMPSIVILKCVFMTLLIVWVCLISYVFPVQSRFENSLMRTIKNALLMSIYHLIPWTCLIVVVNLLPIFLIFSGSVFRIFFVQVMCCIGFAVGAGINSFIFEKIFKEYVDKKNNLD